MIAFKASGCFIGGLAVTVVFIFLSRQLMRSAGFMKVNYAGKKIPGYAGIFFFPALLIMFLAGAFLPISKNYYVHSTRFFALISGMCLFGLIDDVFGAPDEKGFYGHLKSLIRGRMTTGALKAVGGLALSIAVLFPYSSPSWEVLINGSVTALSANLFNLLDTKPGRAIKVFLSLFGLVLFLLIKNGSGFICMFCAAGGAAVALFPGDLRESHMLGDAGSNLIGATIGFGICVGLNRFLFWRIVVLIVVALLNLLSEKYSFSRIIERNKILSWIDKTGTRR